MNLHDIPSNRHPGTGPIPPGGIWTDARGNRHEIHLMTDHYISNILRAFQPTRWLVYRRPPARERMLYDVVAEARQRRLNSELNDTGWAGQLGGPR